MRTRSLLVLTTILCCSAWGQTYTISTFAGGGLPVNVPGASANLGYDAPRYMAADPAGNLFFVDQNTVLRMDAATGLLTLVAGNGTTGFSGDNGPAISAQLNGPTGVAVDSAGAVYIADGLNYRIRKVANVVITTVAGNGAYGVGGDNGPATSAQLSAGGVALDSASNLYVVDTANNRIRKITGGVIATVAGNGSLNGPKGVAVDSAGNLYIADTENSLIRKVANGVISTVAGSGGPGFSGDNGPATSAQLFFPGGVAVDSAGNLYIADSANNRIRKVSNGVITTVAGNGTQGFSGDNGLATSAELNFPAGVAVDSAGNLYIPEPYNNRIRKVSNGVITSVVGNSLSGDNGPATSAQLSSPNAVAWDSAGNLYIADSGRIRKVSNGVITTVAGIGTFGFSGDNGPATSAQLNYPGSVAVDPAGNLYIADTGNHRIRKVSGGVITTVAGNGTMGFSGDNGPATSAHLNYPRGVAVDSAGNLYIADSYNFRVRKVSSGVITTVAGNGAPGFGGGDNGPATSAPLSLPRGIAVDSAGNLYIAEFNSSRIRKVSGGVISTVTGNGTPGFSGDNGPAIGAQLNDPEGVAVDSAGNLYIADFGNSRIRKVSNGMISTIAGNGTPGFSGDGGPATSAQLAYPEGVAADSAGNLYVADTSNYRVRILTPTGAPCTYSVSPTTLPAPASGGIVTVGIRTAASCPWAVSGLPGWISLSGASSGSASASLALAVFPNHSGASLTATVLVAGVSVTVTQPAVALAPLPPIRGVVNAASYIVGAPVSPGEMVTLFGPGLGPATAAYAAVDPATGKLATNIGGVQVLFNGTPAPMIYAGNTQVSAVVPYEMASVSNPSVWIDFQGQTSNAYQLSVAPASPGIFAQNAAGSGPGSILNQDNSLNGPGHAAAKGSIVQVFMTGEGQTTPLGVTGKITTATLPPPQVTPAPMQPISVLVGGQPANFTYAGEAPGFVAGLMQLNVQIPANAPSGALPIQVSIGGNLSQGGITVTVQ
ncbi:MAG TPA: hypothetical protein VKF41_00265 [Bryobacteraceae bacterium]|nr:hypothetical protein [Bryobacteraceae bacterium]